MSDTSNHLTDSKTDEPPRLERAIAAATDALLARQRPDGHWVFELEADATIPAEYVLLRHYLGEPVDAALEAKIAVYLRRIQGAHGGWPLFRDGDFDISASVKAYFALKMIGDDPSRPTHMRRAREAMRARGGAERAQRVHPHHAGAVRLHSVARRAGDAGRDHAAAEMVSVPSRQDVVLEPHRHRAAAGADGEAAEGAQREGRAHRRAVPRIAGGPRPGAEGAAAEGVVVLVLPRRRQRAARGRAVLFRRLPSHQRAIDRAVALVSERLNGEDGLGAIFPAMANSVMMFDVLGYPEGHPQRAIARKSIEKLLVVQRARSLLPALRVADLGHRPRLPRAARSRRRARGRAGQEGPRLAGAAAGARRARRLDRAAARPASRRLGVPIRQSALSRRRRYRRRRHGHGSRRRKSRAARIFAPRSSARANGSSACRARTAPGAPSMPTTSSTTSTTSRSPTMARCSIRRPRTSPRAACRCWRSSASGADSEPGAARARSTICAAPSSPTAAGTAAGA